MSIMTRLKHKGGSFNFPPRTVNVATGGTIKIQPNDSVIFLTSAGAYDTATTVVFVGSEIKPGRTVVLYNSNSSNAITLKHTAGGSATEGYFTGSADLALGAFDCVTIMQITNGSWIRVASADNAAS